MTDDDATTLARRDRAPTGAADADPERFYLRLVYIEQGGEDHPDIDRTEVLAPGAPIVLGRKPKTTGRERAWPLAGDGWASRTHSRVQTLATGGAESVVVADLRSSNGTFLDGLRVAGRGLAREGSVLRVGGRVFVLGRAPLGRAAEIRARRPPPKGLDTRAWPMLALWDRIVTLAGSDAGVLLGGEMGTGKTRLARLLHERSPRRGEPFVSFNCSAIPVNLEEATLFGVVGGFIPTVKERKGWLTLAGRGTLLLDELGDMPPVAQAKLLDAFDPSAPSYVPVGGTRRLKTTCRLVSATNRDVFELARQGALRQDLLSRLVVAHLVVPPLRERREDLLAIFGAAVRRASRGGRSVVTIETAELAEAMLLPRWVENARGLESLATRAALGEQLTAQMISAHADRGAMPAPEPGAVADTPPPRTLVWPPTPDELLLLLVEHGWNVRAAADAIGKRRETVTRLLTATFGGRDASKRAWRIREASGRLPEKDAIDRLYRLFCEAPTGPDVEAAREAWRARGVLP